MRLRGTYTAILTPFTKGGEKVDFDALKKLVHNQINSGIEGLVPCGTTGESPTLSHNEHLEVIAKVTQWAKDQKPDIVIIAGTGSNSTKEAIELTKAAAKDGADYALVVNPYYNKPTQSGLEAHFTAIADASEIPLVLYNIPGRTNVTIEVETMKKLAQHKNIVGVKEATGDLNFITQVRTQTPDDFTVLSGDDNLTLPVLAIGGDGVVSVISNLFPKETGAITRLFFEGKIKEAQKLFLTMFPLFKAMFYETNPIPLKYAASKLGICQNELRLPMAPLSQKYCDKLQETMDQVMKELNTGKLTQ